MLDGSRKWSYIMRGVTDPSMDTMTEQQLKAFLRSGVSWRDSHLMLLRGSEVVIERIDPDAVIRDALKIV